jgi:hypothetical protein
MLRSLPHSKELGWWSTHSDDPLLARLPRAPHVPKFLVDRARSIPLALLLALPPAILYGGSV